MKVLVIGASGLAGRKIFSVLNKKHKVYGTYFSQKSEYTNSKNMFRLDISKKEDFINILETTAPQVIISCLRGEFTEQLEIHRIAALHISSIDNGKLIYLSTANVFDQFDTHPNYEFDPVAAESDYGFFKINCENLLNQMLAEKAVMIRIPFIWSQDCPRIKSMVYNIEHNLPLQVWSNLFTNHTTDIQIANYIDFIIDNNMQGIFHVGSSEPCDYMEFITDLITSMNLPLPTLEVEQMEHKSYLAVLSARNDIPPHLKLSNSDIIHYLTKSSV